MFTQIKGYVSKAGKKGRGVFASKKLRRGEIIDIAPYIAIPRKEEKNITDTIINCYWFDLEKKGAAIGLGLTSIYNHSEDSNAEFSINKKKRTITIKAERSIGQNEEITINYGYKLEL